MMDGSETLRYVSSCSLNFKELKAWNSGGVTGSVPWYKTKVKTAQRDKQQDPETGSPLKCFGFLLLMLF
jgi:hypothetical protein